MAQTRNLLDRLDDYCDKWYDKVAGLVDRNDPSEVPPFRHEWWIVSNRVTTGMVITDQHRCIIIAPIEWNRFLGMTLDALLGQVHAQAVSIPGPHPDVA